MATKIYLFQIETCGYGYNYSTGRNDRIKKVHPSMIATSYDEIYRKTENKFGEAFAIKKKADLMHDLRSKNTFSYYGSDDDWIMVRITDTTEIPHG